MHLRLEYQLSPNAPAQDGTRAVRLRIYAGQPPVFITVTRCAPADFIPARKGRPAEVRGNRPATNVMRVMKSRAEQIYSDMILAGEHITSAAIKARLEGAPSQDFLAWARESIEADPELARSSKAQHRTLLGKVARFAGGGLPFTALTYSWLRQFENWLSSQETERGSLPSRSYVVRNMALLRRNCKEAYRQGKLKEDPFHAYEVKRAPQQDKVWLTEEEVMAIVSVDTRAWKGKLEAVKQIALMQFYTGLRWGDAKGITAGDFYVKDGPELWLRFRPEKTKRAGNLAHFPITGKFEGRAERWIFRLMERKGPSDRLLINNISNKQANKNLKRLAKAAGLDKHITTHTFRHSFAMHMLNVEGYTIAQLAGMLGHTELKTTQEYARLLPENLGRGWKKK